MFSPFGKKKTEPEVSPGGSVILRYEASEPEFPRIGSVEKAEEYRKIRAAVYQRRFGEAKQVYHEMPPFLPHIDVFEYYRAGKDGQVCVLVTGGMSDLPMRVPEGKDAPRRLELIFYCSEPKREYAETMRLLARFPHDQKTWIGAFHTIPNGNPPAPLWETQMDTFFFLPPIVLKDQTLREDLVLDGDAVEFLWIAPLTKAECKLKLDKGSSAILDLFQKNRHPHVFNPERASYA